MTEEQGPRNTEQYNEELEIDLREYVKLLWQAKWLLATIFIVAVAAAFIYSSFILEEEFETYTTIQLSNIDHVYSRPDTARQLIKSEKIAGDIIREFNGKQEWNDHRIRRFISGNLEVEKIEGTEMISLTVQGNNPGDVKEMADGIAESFLNASHEEFDRELDIKEDEMARYEERMNTYEERVIETEKEIERIAGGDLDPVAENLISNSVSQRLFNYFDLMEDSRDSYFRMEERIDDMERARIINPAFTPESPSAPSVRLNMAIAGVLAIMLGVFAVFFREFMKGENAEN